VATPVLELSAVIVTVWGVPKLDGVNVSEPPPVTESPVFPDVLVVVSVTFEVGAADNETANVPVLPCVADSEVGFATMLAPPLFSCPVHWTPLSENEVGLTLLPL